MSNHLSNEENTDWMNRLTQTIHQHLEDPQLTNAKLASFSGLSERQFYRRVELFTGMSPNQYIREIRMKKAEELLSSGDFRTVKEVALRVGFLKVSYFSKLYRDREGRSPAEILRSLDD